MQRYLQKMKVKADEGLCLEIKFIIEDFKYMIFKYLIKLNL